MNRQNSFHPRFQETPSQEHYCEMQYVHWASNDKPRYPSIKKTFRC